MDDRDIERILSRYQPASPPSTLRERVLEAPAPAGRTWPWAAAAAAVLVTTMWFRAQVGELVKDAHFVTGPDLHAVQTAELAEMLGGDDAARRRARALLAEQELYREYLEPAGVLPHNGDTQ